MGTRWAGWCKSRRRLQALRGLHKTQGSCPAHDITISFHLYGSDYVLVLFLKDKH